jgi:beta-galactosidase
VDETGKWFETPLPGRLTDVFGLRTNEFYRSQTPLEIDFDGARLIGTDAYYEVLELDTATPLAMFGNTPQKSPAIAINRYGKGQAIYLATAAQGPFIAPLIRSLYASLHIARGPQTPAGVVARVVDGRTLYVNTNDAPASVTFPGSKTGALTRKTYSGRIELEPFGVELVQ